MRVGGVCFDHVSESCHTDVDTSVEGVTRTATEAVHDEIAAEYAIGMTHEYVEEIELGSEQVDFGRAPIEYALLRIKSKRSKFVIVARI